MPVNTVHPLKLGVLKPVKITRDAADGEQKIKAGGYLPSFIPHDAARYDQYLTRAYYVNVTGRTLNSLIGAVFRKDLTAELPERLAYIEENADGKGLSLDQMAKRAISETLVAGGCGLLVDYPPATGDTLVDDKAAYICPYCTESVINWDTTTEDGRTKLSMVVLQETTRLYSDEYTWSDVAQYRVLRLEDGLYIQEVYDANGALVERYEPRQGGARMAHIPFHFIGAVDNDPNPDMPPLYDLAVVNIAHFRNIADYEEGVHLNGQPMLIINTGDTSASEFNETNPNGVTVGSRRGLALQNGSAMLLQAAANSAAFEAMAHKELQMVAIGARLISAQGINQTAEAARIAASAESSVLNTVVGNTSEAFEAALEDVALFMGVPDGEVELDINRDYFDSTLSAQDAMMLIQFADRGDIAQSDVRDRLRQTGWLKEGREDEDIDDESMVNVI